MARDFAYGDASDGRVNVNSYRRTGHAERGRGDLGNAWVSRGTNLRNGQGIPASGASLSVSRYGYDCGITGLICESVGRRSRSEGYPFTGIEGNAGARAECDAGGRDLRRDGGWAAAPTGGQKRACDHQKSQCNSGKELSHGTLQKECPACSGKLSV